MSSWASENGLWALGFVLNALLLVVLLAKRSYKGRPFFSAWMLQALLASASLFFITRYGSEQLYSVVYWRTAYIEVLLQIAVAFEFARKALCHRGKWVDGTKGIFLGSLVFASALSLIFAVWIQPVVRDRDYFYLRVDLFASLLVFAIAVCTVSIAYTLGSIWNKDELYWLGGFIVWSAAGAFNDTLHAYWRTADHFASLELVETAIGQGVVLYWICLLLFQRRQSPIQPHADIENLSLFIR